MIKLEKRKYDDHTLTLFYIENNSLWLLPDEICTILDINNKDYILDLLQNDYKQKIMHITSDERYLMSDVISINSVYLFILYSDLSEGRLFLNWLKENFKDYIS